VNKRLSSWAKTLAWDTCLKNLDSLHRIYSSDLVDQPAPSSDHASDLVSLRNPTFHYFDSAYDSRDDGVAHQAERHIACHTQRLELHSGVIDGMVLSECTIQRLFNFMLKF